MDNSKTGIPKTGAAKQEVVLVLSDVVESGVMSRASNGEDVRSMVVGEAVEVNGGETLEEEGAAELERGVVMVDEERPEKEESASKGKNFRNRNRTGDRRGKRKSTSKGARDGGH